MFLNHVRLIGNLTADAEFADLPSGSKVLKFGMATNWKTAKSEGVDFHNVEMFGNVEGLAPHMTKGKQVMVEGRLKTDTWEKDGEKRSRVKVVATRLELGSSPAGSSDMSAQGEDSAD